MAGSDEIKKVMDYYRATAFSYEETHVRPGDEHFISLNHASSFVKTLNIKSILDVGCGTGRGVRYFLDENFGMTVKGIDVSGELLKVAVEKKTIPPSCLISGDAYSLPFPDGSFDAAIELGILHHVKNPNKVVEEMLRVSKIAVFISDDNRFGLGTGFMKKMAKLFLYQIGLWKLINQVKTGGKGYRLLEGDGINYSYSPYDSYSLLKKKAARIITIPLSGKHDHTPFTLFNASHLFVCAIKDQGKNQ